MKNLAYDFAKTDNDFILTSKVRSCAWAMTAEFSAIPSEDGTPIDGEADLYCHDMPDADLLAAKTIGIRALDTITGSPAKLPPGPEGDGWPGDDCDLFDPALAEQGRFAPPMCRSAGHRRQ